MITNTFQELYDRFLEESDISQDQSIVDREEVIKYINYSMVFIESFVQTINFGRSYFKSDLEHDYDEDQSYYPSPKDMYGNKVISVLLTRQGTDTQNLLIRFAYDNTGESDYNFANAKQYGSSISRIESEREFSSFNYDFINRAGEGQQIRVYPKVTRAEGAKIVISYQRECQKIVRGEDGQWDLSKHCELPRFDAIIGTYVKMSIKNKAADVHMSTEQIGILTALVKQKMTDVGIMTNDTTESIRQPDIDFYVNST